MQTRRLRMLTFLLATGCGEQWPISARLPFAYGNALIFRCGNIVLGSGWAMMDYDHEKVDEVVLALLCLTISEEDDSGARAWKSHDWNALDRLHAKGYIADPKSKAKSVVLSPEGLKRARELFERNFAAGRQSP